MQDPATTRPEVRTRSRVIVVVLFVAVATACNQSPVAPRRVWEAQPAQARPGVQVEGLVIDSIGKPVPGATVTALSLETGAPLASTTSNDEGAYSLLFPTPATWHPVKVEGDGFEPSVHYVTLSVESTEVVRRDLRLHKIWQVRAGNTVELTIDRDDPACSDFLDEWACRTIRIVNPGGNFVRAWVLDGRAVIKQAGFRGSATSRVDAPIAGGEELVLEVMATRVPLAVTLYTSHD
jgi:hypothetical protein